jgi:hypothetical protein
LVGAVMSKSPFLTLILAPDVFFSPPVATIDTLDTAGGRSVRQDMSTD